MTDAERVKNGLRTMEIYRRLHEAKNRLYRGEFLLVYMDFDKMYEDSKKRRHKGVKEEKIIHPSTVRQIIECDGTVQEIALAVGRSYNSVRSIRRNYKMGKYDEILRLEEIGAY